MSFKREKQNHHLPVEQCIRKEVQPEVYQDEVKSIMKGSKPPKTSSFLSINLVLDPDGILRVWGHLQNMSANWPDGDNHDQIIIPKAIILHYPYVSFSLQHTTSRTSLNRICYTNSWLFGLWVECHQSFIYKLRRCVTCKKLNRSFAWTKMADFPRDRLETGPPFTFVDIDNFGPWAIVYRKTQGMQRATTAGLFCSHAWCLELSMSSSLRS